MTNSSSWELMSVESKNRNADLPFFLVCSAAMIMLGWNGVCYAVAMYHMHNLYWLQLHTGVVVWVLFILVKTKCVVTEFNKFRMKFWILLTALQKDFTI